MHRVIHREKPKADVFKSLSTEFYKQNPDVDTATISIVAGKPKRSAVQSKLYWYWMALLGQHLGMYKDSVHLVVSHKFLDLVKAEFGGEEFSERKSTTSLNVTEFIDYLCEIEIWADEFLKYQLPHGSDYNFAVMGKR